MIRRFQGIAMLLHDAIFPQLTQRERSCNLTTCKRQID